MAESRLKIDESGMREQAAAMESAIAAYKGFDTAPFSAEIGYLEGMNADFIARFQTMLENVNDDNSKFIDRLEEIQKLCEDIVSTFEEVDDTAAESMGYTQEG